MLPPSLSPISIDPERIRQKADELRARYDGAELLRLPQICQLLGCTNSAAYFRRRDGNFPPVRKDNGYNVVGLVDDVAAYLIYGKDAFPQPLSFSVPEARAYKTRKTADVAPKPGRPRKSRSKAAA